MGAWYWIGVAAGLGAALGLLVAGLAGSVRGAVIAGAVAAVLAGAAVGYAVDSWRPGGIGDIAAAAVGSLLGMLGAAQIVSGTLRRGGTRGGTATLVTVAALAAAGLAWIPVVGYLEALALPAVAARLRRSQPERYAGLRTLARD